MKDFFVNVLRYPRYFITFLLGIFYSVYQWVRPMVRNQVAAWALLGFGVSTLAFLSLTLRAMLGQAIGEPGSLGG